MSAIRWNGRPDPFADLDEMVLATEPKVTPISTRRVRAKKADPFADLDEPKVTPEPKPPKRTYKLPKREVDYRKALHDSTKTELSSTALLAGLAICQRCWQSKELYASQKTVAEWMHLAPSSVKSVRNAVQELETAGFLHQLGKRGSGTLHYKLTIPVR